MTIQEKPEWTDAVLQGLAYWVGYKKQYYKFYPLSEGAIVGETLSLLSSHLPKGLRIDPEVMYKKICSNCSSKNSRADIVISRHNKKNHDAEQDVSCIIEVKREDAPKRQIKKDLTRLANYISKTKNEEARAFLLLVSQGKRPEDFVTKKGNAKHENIKIAEYEKYIAKVRRVCKATSKFDNRNHIVAADNAHYACLIEVIKKED
jgi:hypothetical protein